MDRRRVVGRQEFCGASCGQHVGGRRVRRQDIDVQDSGHKGM